MTRFDFSKFSLLIAASGLFYIPVNLIAQRSDESVRIQVHRNQEGNVLQIEEDVPATDAKDLEQLMKKYGMSDELTDLKPGEEVEIVITRKQTVEEPKVAKPDFVAKPESTKVVERKQAFLGVHYEMTYNTTRGSRVTKVEPNTPASRGGLQQGDIITKIEDVDLVVLDDLSRVISTKKGGDKVKLTLIRNGATKSVLVTLADRDEDFFRRGPSYEDWNNLNSDHGPSGNIWIEDEKVKKEDAGDPFLGVMMIHTEKRTNINGRETVEESEGALVDEVIPNSTASEMGMRKGDLITFVDRKPINRAGEVTDLINSKKAGEKIEIEFMRDGHKWLASGVLKDKKGFNVPESRSITKEFSDAGNGDVESDEMFERVRKMMDEARARSNGSTTVREFRMVIKMDVLSAAEAQSLSIRSGQRIKSESDLDLQGLRLSPNPSTGKFNVFFELPNQGTTEISVLDMNGKCVYFEKLPEFKGKYSKDFDISQESKGNYVLFIQQNGKSFTRKIVTQ